MYGIGEMSAKDLEYCMKRTQIARNRRLLFFVSYVYKKRFRFQKTGGRPADFLFSFSVDDVILFSG